MSLGQGQNQPLSGYHQGIELRILNRKEQQTEIDDLAPQSLDLFGWFHFANIDGDVRSLTADASQKLRQHAAYSGADRSDHEVSGFPLSGARGFASRLIELLEDAKGAVAEQLPGGGQAHSPVGSLDKLGIQLIF